VYTARRQNFDDCICTDVLGLLRQTCVGTCVCFRSHVALIVSSIWHRQLCRVVGRVGALHGLRMRATLTNLMTRTPIRFRQRRLVVGKVAPCIGRVGACTDIVHEFFYDPCGHRSLNCLVGGLPSPPTPTLFRNVGHQVNTPRQAKFYWIC